MAIHVDYSEAEKVLLGALKSSCKKSDDISNLISEVISGTHKTYKYILITGLLAKATSEEINPLTLQAGAPLKGAYDARSLCHKIFVPFERNFLHNALGGSNEPFLNKPARFTHLSNTNAVRKGNDKKTLETLIKIFNHINSSKMAKEYLSCALAFVVQRIEHISKLEDSSILFNPDLVDIYEFLINFLGKSFEGETCEIVVGTIEKIYHSQLKGNHLVVPHKTNQCGASSKEIGDIDIFNEGVFQYSFEVKDKSFTAHDVEHAFNKIIKNKGKKGVFIYGPRSSFDPDPINAKLDEYEDKKFFTLFISINTYLRIMLLRSNISDKNTFIKTLMDTAIEVNSKDSVKLWIQEILKKLNWK